MFYEIKANTEKKKIVWELASPKPGFCWQPGAELCGEQVASAFFGDTTARSALQASTRRC